MSVNSVIWASSAFFKEVVESWYSNITITDWVEYTTDLCLVKVDIIIIIITLIYNTIRTQTCSYHAFAPIANLHMYYNIITKQ